MDLATNRRTRLMSAAFLLALAPLARAGSIQNLRDGSARPDDFERIIDGSDQNRPGLAEPGASGRREGRPALNPASAYGAARPPARLLPLPSAAASAHLPAPRRLSTLDRIAWTAELPVRKLAAALGLGFMLIAASMMHAPAEEAPAFEALHAARPLPPITIARAPDAPNVPSPVDEPFIDARRPTSTWRAISWKEQQLIDGWNASPEKARGLASLTEWLDLKAPIQDVDVPMLKAKLYRA